MGRLGWFRVVCVGAIAFAIQGRASAADCADPLGRLVSLEGVVEVQRSGAVEWRPAGADQPLCPGDSVRVGDRSRAAAELRNDNKLRLDQNTTLRLILPADPERSLLDLWSGAAYFFSRKKQSLDVRTPVVNAAVEGTEFLVSIDAERTLVGVVHGRIRAANAYGEIVLEDGDAATATATTPPVSTLLVRPLDAVQWAIYYPSILPFVHDPGARAPAGLSPDLAAAIDAASAGRTGDAFALFAAIPEADRDATFYLYRAATLLGVGRADEASADIDALLTIDPQNATAWGLRAVIAVARNDTDQGLADANRAVELDPASAPALIALSYAEQAQFRITAAREAAERATTVAPDNPLAWARLSELWLMQGWRDRSREAAARARELAPDLERVHTVAGFAALSEFDTGRASDAFRRAIEISPGNPLPRLGLGLATIRTGSLRQGRRDLETAVLLDPDDALLRSYLGKAYFEEKRDRLAATQYELAKEIDPRDPTAFFYSAIQKQTENRPVEALRDLETSIELNDDRAVYRSRELLDSDRAARGASLGRIYDDLGFQQLGVNAATRSLSFDPANAAAHRFLSDIYASEHRITTSPARRETARLSEQLQAQLLQDININPVQPSLSVNGFNVPTTGGPARPGFNEFNPLFERNQAQLNVTGLVGNNGTWGDEAVISGVYDRYSVSAGQFRYQTDGFRDNSDLTNEVYDVYGQVAVTPDLNVQAELIRSSTSGGFLPLLFDKDLTVNSNADVSQDSARTGLRYSFDPNNMIITSFLYAGYDNELKEDEQYYNFAYKTERVGGQFENLFMHNATYFNAMLGVGMYRIKNKIKINDTYSDWFATEKDKFSQKQASLFLYTNINPNPDLILTLGLGFDDYAERDIDVTKISPKLGLEWQLNPHLTLRAAAFRTVSAPLLSSQTIQPTQVAGFNQLYNDFAGTEAWRYGVACDAKLSDDVSAGLELSQRNIQEDNQFLFSESDFKEQRKERMVHGYIFVTLGNRLSVSIDGIYDKYYSNDQETSILPDVKTISSPISIRYFDPSGIFAGLTWTFVHQTVDYAEFNDDDYSNFEGTSNFNLLDAAIGYRLPKRLGIVSLQGTNLLGASFNYQDDSFRASTRNQYYSPYLPDRGVLARVTLNLQAF